MYSFYFAVGILRDKTMDEKFIYNYILNDDEIKPYVRCRARGFARGKREAHSKILTPPLNSNRVGCIIDNKGFFILLLGWCIQ